MDRCGVGAGSAFFFFFYRGNSLGAVEKEAAGGRGFFRPCDDSLTLRSKLCLWG